jgi:peptide/nickel transport system substrate-binding protein
MKRMTIDRRTFLTGAAVLPFVGLTTREVFADTGKDVLVVALQTDNVTSLDPHEGFEAVGGEINSNLYQKLVRSDIDDPNQIRGEIAESWSMSEDGKTLTMKIRSGLKFASGGPLSAADCAFSLSRAVIMNKSPAFIINQFGFTKDNVAERITAPDATTLVLKLEKPTATTFLLNCLSANVAAILEKKVVLEKAVGDDLGNGFLRQNSAGSGPWVLRSWKPSESVVFDFNPQSGPVNGIKRIIIRHIVDPSAQLLMLQKGDVDVARNLNSEQLKQLQGDANYTLVRRATASVMAISMNQKVPQLAKPEVRQAIKWAIDYEGIQKNIVPMTHIMRQSFLPDGYPAAQKEGPFKRDVAKAKALMAAAGLADGFDVSFDHYSAQPGADIAQALQANLADIGIRVRLLASENRQVLTRMRARQHEMALTVWGSDYFDPNTNAEAYCVNTDNSDDARNRTLAWRNSWKDDEITKFALDALEEKDAEKRKELYLKLQVLHQERSPFAPLLQTVTWAVCRKNVQGIRLGVLPDANSYASVKKI